MKVKLAMMVGIAVDILMFACGLARAQSDVPRFEVGAQYSLLNFDTSSSFSNPRRWESGGGGRFTFNFNKYVAAEAQIDYFPNEDSERIGTYSEPLWGSKTLTVAGVKAGTRTDRWGIFGKARPELFTSAACPRFYLLLVPVCNRLKRTLRSMLAASLNITHLARWWCDSTLATRSSITRESSELRISFKRALALACALSFTQDQLFQ